MRYFLQETDTTGRKIMLSVMDIDHRGGGEIQFKSQPFQGVIHESSTSTVQTFIKELANLGACYPGYTAEQSAIPQKEIRPPPQRPSLTTIIDIYLLGAGVKR